MTTTTDTSGMGASREDFAAMLDESFALQEPVEGSVIKGTIVAIEKDLAVIDVGLKMEGRVPLKEFAVAGKSADLS
ncbi:MAG: S1 RNA-binding domain-containing protein, partial [Pseudomonadota bacterium]